MVFRAVMFFFGDSGKFHTSVYRKPTFSGVLIRFERFLPISYKYNRVSFSYRTLHFKILKLKQIIRSNSYPENFVNSCIKIYLDKVLIKYPNICIVTKKELVCVFPFLGKKSLEIKKLLQNAIERKLPYCKLKGMFKSPSKNCPTFSF